MKDLTKMSTIELEVFEQNLRGELDTRIRNMIEDPRVLEIYEELDAIEDEKGRREENLKNG